MPTVTRTTTELPTTADAGDETAGRFRRLPTLPRRWSDVPDSLRWSLIVYLVSRIPVVIGMVMFLHTYPKQDLTFVLMRQDGWWYTRIAEQGYTASLHPVVSEIGDYHHNFSEWAFFPGYPLLARGVAEVTSLGVLRSAMLVAIVFGFLAVWSLYVLGASFGGAQVGRIAALLFAVWPGSTALSLPYSEGLYVTAAALALYFIIRERWLAAGLLGAVATATRPTGLGIIAAAAAVAVVRLVRYREVRPFLAPLLSLVGIGGFVLYGGLRTGDFMVWRHAENLWNQELDFSKALAKRSLKAIEHPVQYWNSSSLRVPLVHAVFDTGGALLLLAMVVAAVVLWRRGRRVSLAWAVYAAVTIALIVAYSAVAPRPRTVLAIIPGFVWLAAWLPKRVAYGFAAVCLVVAPVVIYMWSWRVTP
jgi:Gpi18-like mannosyltransferase